MPRPNPYTEEMDNFIRDNILDKGTDYVLNGLKEKFGFETKYHSLLSHCQRKGIKASYRKSITDETVKRMKELQDECSSLYELYQKLDIKLSYNSFMRYINTNHIELTCGKYLDWKDEWIKWLKNNHDDYYSYHMIATVMNEKFGDYFTTDIVKRMGQKLGLKRVNHGGYAIKGVHKVPLGQERNSVEDDMERVRIKIGINKWQSKQTYIWNKTYPNDTVQEDELVIFLDGDRTNFSLDNLYKVKRNVALNLGKSHMRSDDAEVTKTAVMMWELHDKIKEANNG